MPNQVVQQNGIMYFLDQNGNTLHMVSERDYPTLPVDLKAQYHGYTMREAVERGIIPPATDGTWRPNPELVTNPIAATPTPTPGGGGIPGITPTSGERPMGSAPGTWSQLAQRPDDSPFSWANPEMDRTFRVKSDDLYGYAGSAQESWNTAIEILRRKFRRGTWHPSWDSRAITDPKKRAEFEAAVGVPPEEMWGSLGEAETMSEVDSPQLDEFIRNYLNWMLTNTNDATGKRYYDTSSARTQLGPLLSGEEERAQTKAQLVANIYQAYVDDGDKGVTALVTKLGAGDLLTQIMPQFVPWMQVRNQAKQFAETHELAVTRLAADVARYDAELAANPRNWVRYGAWLRSSGMLVNGLTLAMAANMVPDEQLLNAPGAAEHDPVNAVNTLEEVNAGRSAGGAPPMPATGPETGSPDGAKGAGTGPGQTQTRDLLHRGGAGQQQPIGSGPSTPTGMVPAADAGTELSQLAQTQGTLINRFAQRPSFSGWQAEAQTAADLLRTSPGPRGAPNAVGIDPGETRGHRMNIQRLGEFSPAQIQMKAGLAESGGGTWQDIVDEARKAAPQGSASRTPLRRS